MRVLVTGARGQVGRELLSQFGDAAVAPDVDVADRDAVFQAVTAARPDAVVHAAAWTAVDACEDDRDRALRVNALGTRHVAQAARLVGASVCYLSTDYVFDGRLVGRGYTEWDDPNPLSAYGRSKLGGERELDAGRDLIVRTSWVFGRHGSNIVKTVLRLADQDGPLRFVDDQRGCPTCAEDVARVVRGMVHERRTGLFHVTNQGAASWFDLAREVMQAAGHDPGRVEAISTAELGRRAPRPANSVLDNAALRLSGLELLADHREPVERVVKELMH